MAAKAGPDRCPSGRAASGHAAALGPSPLPSPALPATPPCRRSASSPTTGWRLGRGPATWPPSTPWAAPTQRAWRPGSNHSSIPTGIDDSACTARIIAAGLPTLGKTLTQLWADHYNGDGGRTQPVERVTTATFIRAVYSRRQLKEVLADFWHNHFSVYAWDYAYASATWVHYDRDVIRANVLGNFRTMLEAVATQPGHALLPRQLHQPGGRPQRELRRASCSSCTRSAPKTTWACVDPFSIPVDGNGTAVGYCDNDVYESARSFTGWTRQRRQLGRARRRRHLLLPIPPGTTRPTSSSWAITSPPTRPTSRTAMTCSTSWPPTPAPPATSARKLCRRLVGDDPPQSLVDAAAAVFTAALGRARPAQAGGARHRPVARIRGHLGPEDQASLRGRRRGAARQRRRVHAHQHLLSGTFNRPARPCSRAARPTATPTASDWSNTTSLLQRWRLVNHLVQNNIDGATLNFLGQMPGEHPDPQASSTSGSTGCWAGRWTRPPTATRY